MKKKFGILGKLSCALIATAMCFSGCGKAEENIKEEVIQQEAELPTDEAVVNEGEYKLPDVSRYQVQPDGEYLEVALNVYYNDSEHSYYTNEAGASIYVTGEGTYTVNFDCDSDLSAEAKAAGVNSLTNLTAIYLLDMGVAAGHQSELTQADIMFNNVVVDGTELTITQAAPKSAFKSNGVFDTNDPINAWDGSQVEEVQAGSDHVANFTSIERPTKISVTFTLSNMNWASGKQEEEKELNNELIGRNTAKFSDIDFTNVDALSFTKMLGNGINLGNTMEAYGHATLGTKASVQTYETYWGQPVTTAEMFKGMKDCGFDTVRIPVSWTNTMDYEGKDYTISKAYLDRVEEIVNYALDAEMFVIVNDHWDGGWWSKFGSATPSTVDEAWTIYESIWTQVADRFKDYSDMLIFESANEELGNSLNDNSHCPDSGSLSADECYSMTNKINQKFVDIVRNSGGKNDKRFLLIAGYNTDFEKTVDNRFKMPKDTVAGKLLLSVHYYTPWNYCGAEKQARWGLKSEYEDMNKLFAKLQKFTDAGYGVIIGEYGALPVFHSDTGKHELKENTIEFTTNLLDNCDLYNYCPVLWSCNDFFIRKSGSMASEELDKLFTSRRYELEKIDINSLKASMEANVSKAKTMWDDVKTVPAGAPVAWIMWNGGAGTYSVGDVYNPADCTNGIKATDVIISGAGEYEVSLDFADGNNGLTFGALAIANGESLFAHPIIDIKEITVDGKKLDLIAKPYTSSDNKICTRVNLINEWVSAVPDDARTVDGDKTDISAVILDKTKLVDIKNITIKFELIMGKR